MVTYSKSGVEATGFRSGICGERVGITMRERTVVRWIVFVLPGVTVGRDCVGFSSTQDLLSTCRK